MQLAGAGDADLGGPPTFPASTPFALDGEGLEDDRVAGDGGGDARAGGDAARDGAGGDATGDDGGGEATSAGGGGDDIGDVGGGGGGGDEDLGDGGGGGGELGGGGDGHSPQVSLQLALHYNANCLSEGWPYHVENIQFPYVIGQESSLLM